MRLKKYTLFSFLLFLSSITFAQVPNPIGDVSQKTYEQNEKEISVDKAKAEYRQNTLFIINGKKQNRAKDSYKIMEDDSMEVLKIITKEKDVQLIIADTTIKQVIFLKKKRNKDQTI